MQLSTNYRLTGGFSEQIFIPVDFTASSLHIGQRTETNTPRFSWFTSSLSHKAWKKAFSTNNENELMDKKSVFHHNCHKGF